MKDLDKYIKQGMDYAADTLRTYQGGPLNIQMPTLGGKQFWRDEFIYVGWRIQFNLFSGHFRLLDPEDHRQAWGSYDDCMDAFEKAKTERGIEPILHPGIRGVHLVLMVHGITRSGDTFSKMKLKFQAQGYEAAAITYPSTRALIQDHADQIARILSRRDDVKTVSFVTHSMGGLVARQLLVDLSSWKADINIGRLLMIAPPNQGSMIAEWLKQKTIYQLIYGRSGQELVPSVARQLPIPSCPMAIIAGGKADGKGYNPILDGDDDGVVTVEEAQLIECEEFLVLPGIHTTICSRGEVIGAALNYIRSGRLSVES